MKGTRKVLPLLISALIVSTSLQTIGGARATDATVSILDETVTITGGSMDEVRMGAWVDEVIITAEPDFAQAVFMLGTGDIDVYASATTDRALLDEILSHPEIDYALIHGGRRELRFNTYRDPETKAPFFRDGRLNPFAVPEIREAMNWLIDREFIVDEYLDGMGSPVWAPLAVGSPDHGLYYDVVEDIEAAYAYSFSAAKGVFDTQMPLMGAERNNESGLWYYGGRPVEVIFVMRSDLSPFPEAGHYVADQLEALGFEVVRLVKPSWEATGIWYGGDPADGLFHIASGGWVAPGVVRDLGGVFDLMYTHRAHFDSLLWVILEEQLEEFPALAEASWRLRLKDFTSMDERKALFSTALTEALRFSNCIWVTQVSNAHAYRQDVALVADLAAGVLGQSWAHTVHFHDGGEPVAGGTLNFALPHLPGGNWNPVVGPKGAYDVFATKRVLGDAGTLQDPRDGLRHPHRIESAVVTVWDQLPVKSSLPWVTLVEAADPIPVPDYAWVDWDAQNQVFITAAQKKATDPGRDQTALTKSVVVYPDDIYSVPLHDGSSLSLGDFLMAMIMTFDRGKPESPVYDASYEAERASFLHAFKGMEIIHDGLGTEPLTIATYSDLWHLDAELNVTTWFPAYGTHDWTGFWHMITVGWLADAAGELAFSGAKAGHLGIPHMAYTRGPSLPVLEYWMNWAAGEGFIPYEPTLGQYIDTDEIAERWANLQEWYAEMGHFWVGNGPFYLHSLAEDPPRVVLKRFGGYPDPADRWLFLMSNALSVTSTEGGSVVLPGEGAFSFDADTVVDLIAEAEEGYRFVNWTGDVGTIANPDSASTSITMSAHFSVTANFVEDAAAASVETKTGTGTACFTPSQGTIEDLHAVPAVSPAPRGVSFPHGMFEFKITGLAEGETVTLAIELPEAVPVGTVWWKYQDGSWYSLPNESDDGDNIMTIRLTDGGPGDTPGSDPGTIVDPGGPGNPVPPLTVGWEGSPVNKAAVAAPWIALLATMIAGAGLLMLRRRLTQN